MPTTPARLSHGEACWHPASRVGSRGEQDGRTVEGEVDCVVAWGGLVIHDALCVREGVLSACSKTLDSKCTARPGCAPPLLMAGHGLCAAALPLGQPPT